MFKLQANKVALEVTEREPVASGAVNAFCVAFTFDESWEGLTRTAVFRAGDTSVEVLLDADGGCVAPWEVLQNAGVPLYAGVYGTQGRTTVLPTIWACLIPSIPEGCAPADPTTEPSPNAYTQVLEQMGDLGDLLTEDKSSLVAAINEARQTGGTGGGGGGGIVDIGYGLAYDEEGALAVDKAQITQDVIDAIPRYTGSYEATPAVEAQSLPTAERYMAEDVQIKAIPYYEVSNEKGGETAIIGGN